MFLRLRQESSGFTIPELITAVAVVFVLLTAIGFILRPQDHQQARYQAEQRLNLAVIMQAINRYQVDKGLPPPGITEQYTFIGTQDGQVDLCKVLVPAYLKDLPLDTYTGAKAYSPVDENESVTEAHNRRPCDHPHMVYMTGYAVAKDKANRVHVAVLASDLKTPVLSLSQK